MLIMKLFEEIMKFINKVLLNEVLRKCLIYYFCIFGIVGLIGKKKEMDWKMVNVMVVVIVVLVRKRNF